VSGFGWALGYMASFLILVFNLLLIAFEFPNREWAIRLSLLSVGVWWAIFAIPTFVLVKERAEPKPLPAGQNLLTVGFSQVRNTAKKLPVYSQMLLFMGAFFLYNDGIQTTITQAPTFGNVALGATLESIGPAFAMIQIVAFFGSLLFIWIEKRVGTKKSLVYALLVWLVLLGWALMMHSLVEFYVMGFFGALVLGVSQSASRTIYALMIPSGQSAEFFSLYAIVGKTASLVGPFLFGLGAFYAADLEGAPVINSMAAAILPLFLMVLIGTLMLTKVDVAKGRQQARAG
jgi:UMF1 family MFS transporter